MKKGTKMAHSKSKVVQLAKKVEQDTLIEDLGVQLEAAKKAQLDKLEKSKRSTSPSTATCRHVPPSISVPLARTPTIATLSLVW
jgi:hypothetical protein